MDDIQDIKRRAGITEDDKYQSVDVNEFMQYIASYGSLTMRGSGGAVYFYPEGSVKPGYGGPGRERFSSGAVAIYHPGSPKGPFLIDVSGVKQDSGYGSTGDEGAGF